MNAPTLDLDRAAQHCKNFKDPLALAAALLDCGADAETAGKLADEHGHDGARIQLCFDPMIENENSSTDCESTELSEAATASASDTSEHTTAANDVQDLATLAPLGAIHVMRDWTVYPVPATAAGLAQWCRDHRAPDAKPEGTSNAPNLGFLLSPVDDCSGTGHPKIEGQQDVAFTHGCSFDLDKITRAELEQSIHRTLAAGYAAVGWESHSSTEAEPKGRLLVLLDPPCPVEQHARVYEQLRAELCPWAPKGQHNANRGWNPPRASAEVIELEGRPVDWRDVVTRAPRTASGTSPKSPSAAPQGPANIGPANLEFAIKACSSHAPGNEDGNASANLVSLGCKLILACGLDLETAVVTALRYYDPRCMNAAGEPFPWGEAEIRRAFARAASKEPSKDQLQWREALDTATAVATPGTPEHDALMARNATAQAAEIEGMDPVPDAETLNALYSKVFAPLASMPAPRPLSYLCQGLLIAKDVRPAALTCYPGVGKSTAGVELARAVATGTPAFGRFPCERGRVLFIANEGGRGVHDALLRQVPPEHHGNIVLVRDTLLLAGPGSETAFALLERAAKEFDLIVLDSLNSSLPGLDENDARTAEPLGRIEALTSAANGGRAAFVVLRHTGKGTPGKGGKDPMQAGRGTSAIDGRFSVAWLLLPVGDLGTDRSVDWQCTRNNDLDREPPRPFNVGLRDGKFEVSDETGKQTAAKAKRAADEQAGQTCEQSRLKLARSALIEAAYKRLDRAREGSPQTLCVPFRARDAEDVCRAVGIPKKVAEQATAALLVEGTEAPEGDHWFKREGRICFGIDSASIH